MVLSSKQVAEGPRATKLFSYKHYTLIATLTI